MRALPEVVFRDSERQVERWADEVVGAGRYEHSGGCPLSVPPDDVAAWDWPPWLPGGRRVCGYQSGAMKTSPRLRDRAWSSSTACSKLTS